MGRFEMVLFGLGLSVLVGFYEDDDEYGDLLIVQKLPWKETDPWKKLFLFIIFIMS